MDIVYPNKYYSKIKEKFPHLSEKQIDKIITYGLRAIFITSCYNIDIKVQLKKFFLYFGEIILRPDLYVKYRRTRLTAKYRMFARREKKPYNGKYYFILSEEWYKQLPNKKSGKHIPFENLYIYKLREEAELHEGSYLYEVDYPNDVGFKKQIQGQSLKYRLIAKRDKWNKFISLSSDSPKEKTVKRSKKKGGK